jgi:hypothetical protein
MEARPLGRPTLIWEDSIKMDLDDIGWEFVDWIHLTHKRFPLAAVVNNVLTLLVP